jgi:putative zinc finger/helix-turn-helix YgiT family protein
MGASRENYLDVESGLPSVILLGVEVRRCAACGAAEVVLPKVTELHRAIAAAVIRKRSRLSGVEVRFLRKHLGWTGSDFAAHVGVDPTTVSAWENERKPFGTSSDRLLRLMVARHSTIDDYSLADLTKIEDRQDPPCRVEIRPRDHGWLASLPA